MSEIYKRNLGLLKLKDESAYLQVTSHEKNYVEPGRLIYSYDNTPNIEFYYDNKFYFGYDNVSPIKSVNEYLDGLIRGNDKGIAYFIGFGLGYLPLEAIKNKKNLLKIVIIEPWIDMFIFAMKHVDLTPLLKSPKTTFYLGEMNWERFIQNEERMASIFTNYISTYHPALKIRSDLYEDLSNKVYEQLNVFNTNGNTKAKCGHLFLENFIESLKLVNHIDPVDNYQDIYRDIPAICVAAGPSLNKDLGYLKKLEDRAVIIAVDSALAPLKKAGIEPDFVTTIDFQDVNLEKFSEFLGIKNNFGLVLLNKANKNVCKKISSVRRTQIYPAEFSSYVLRDVLLNNNPIFLGAFTSAHLSIQFAFFIGANPIILCGQDLAFPDTYEDHAKDVVFKRTIDYSHEFIEAEGLDNKTVRTNRSFISMKTFFERLIDDIKRLDKDRRIINATHAGLKIKGAERIKLNDLINILPSNQKPKITSLALKRDKTIDIIKLKQNITQTIDKVNFILKQIEEVKRLISEIVKDLVLIKNKKIFDLSQLPEKIINKIHKMDQYNNTIDNDLDTTYAIYELTFEKLAEFDAKKIENEEIKLEKGLYTWLLKELERIRDINTIKSEKLITYKIKLQNLLNFLDKEISLLTEYNNQKADNILLELGKLYLFNSIANLLKDIIDKLEVSNISKSELDILKAGYYLLIYDFDKLEELITKEKIDINNKELKNIAQEEFNNLINMLSSPFKDNYPKVYYKWCERIYRLMQLFPYLKLPTSVLNIWDEIKNYIQTCLEDNEKFFSNTVKIYNYLYQFNPLKDYLSDYIYLKIAYHIRKKELQEALNELKNLDIHKVNDTNLLMIITRLLIATGNIKEGLDYLNYAISIDNSCASIWEDIGDDLFSKQDYESALLAYENCFKHLPKHIYLLQKIGDCYKNLGLIDAANTAYEIYKQKSSRLN